MAQDTTSTLERINSRYEAGMNTKHKGEWYLNLAFYLGEQYVKFENVTNTLVVPKKPSYRVRLTINQIMPRVRTELAKLTQGRHKWEVLPSTSEEEDINVADIATKFLDAKWRELDMERIRQDLLMWCIVCGTSFLEVYWDDEINSVSLNKIDLQNTSKKDLIEFFKKKKFNNLETNNINFKNLESFEISYIDNKTKLYYHRIYVIPKNLYIFYEGEIDSYEDFKRIIDDIEFL